MRSRIFRRLLALAALSLVAPTLTLAQTVSSRRQDQSPPFSIWSAAQQIAATQYKLYIVTTAQPTHRQGCIVGSVTSDQLVCRGHSGSLKAYRPQDIAALIVPGVHLHRAARFIAFTVAGAGVMTGAMFLLSVNIPAALLVSAILVAVTLHAPPADSNKKRPDELLYLASSQTLRVKLSN